MPADSEKNQQAFLVPELPISAAQAIAGGENWVASRASLHKNLNTAQHTKDQVLIVYGIKPNNNRFKA